MSENSWQLLAMIDAITVLQTHFADRPAHVTGDLSIYYTSPAGESRHARAPAACTQNSR